MEAATAAFKPTSDSRVAEAQPRANFGAYNLITSGVVGTRDRSLLKFDVKGISGTVTKATLRVYVFDATNDGPRVTQTRTGWGRRHRHLEQPACPRRQHPG